MRSHDLARILLSVPDDEVLTHEPEFDRYYPVRRVDPTTAGILLTPGYDDEGVEHPERARP